MTKKNDETQIERKQVIRTKQSLFWTHIFMLIQLLEKYPAVTADENFMKIYRTLYDYVSSKAPLPNRGDILDWYVVVEQEATE